MFGNIYKSRGNVPDFIGVCDAPVILHLHLYFIVIKYHQTQGG